MMMNIKKFAPLFITLCVSLLFIPFSFAQQNNQENIEQNFENLISSHKGKIIYLDFWASWCGPCRKSFPWINDMQKTHQQQGFIVISVNVDNDKLLAEEFLSETPANFTIFYDPKGKIARKFKLKGMPSSYIIDRSGKVVSNHVGFSASKKTKYEQEIIALLKAHE
jgi:thiol-disulfide isomerase/thioredoxin